MSKNLQSPVTTFSKISGVGLGAVGRGLRSNVEKTGDEIFRQCIKNQQSLAKSVLKFVNRIPEDQLCFSIEIVAHPSLLLKSTKYDSGYYRNHLETICDAFDCSSLIASVCIQYIEFVKLLADSDLQKKHDTYWKKSGRWDPLGVIESFMNPTFELSDNMEDLCFILSKIGLIRFTQSDTERVVKTIRKTETRFAGYNDIK